MKRYTACLLLAEQHTHDLAAEARLRKRDTDALVKRIRALPTAGPEEIIRRHELIEAYEDKAMEAGSRWMKVIRALHYQAAARFR